MEKTFCVYILASKKNGTLYVGITNDLVRRAWEHKNKLVKGFTEKYGVDKLVYYELFGTALDAIKREKNIKAWKREWKINLIQKRNPNWEDLYEKII